MRLVLLGMDMDSTQDLWLQVSALFNFLLLTRYDMLIYLSR